MKKALLLLVSLVILAVSVPCSADDWSRQGLNEIFVSAEYASNAMTEPRHSDVDIKFDPAAAVAVGYGYNITNNFNINANVNWSQKELRVLGYKDYVNLTGMDLNVDYNILNGHITPLLTAGVGFINFSSVHSDEADTDDTYFSYNAGVGVRWDITKNLFTKLVYDAKATTIKHTNDPLLFHTGILTVGFSF